MSLLSKPIEIRPRIAGIVFIERIKTIAEESGTFEIPCEGSIEGTPFLDLEPHPSPVHTNLKARLVSQESPDRIEVLLFASEWKPELSYDTYTSTARRVLVPLLSLYNKRFGARIRLGISGPRKPPKLSTGAADALSRFESFANKRCPHPADWNLFYRFIVYCHDHHVSYGSEYLGELLLQRGFDSQVALELTTAYRHGRALLGVQSEARRDWMGRLSHKGEAKNV